MQGEGCGKMRASMSTLVFAVNARLSLSARRWSFDALSWLPYVTVQYAYSSKDGAVQVDFVGQLAAFVELYASL